MTDMDLNHPLVGRLATLRRRVRFFLGLYGAGVVLTTLAGGALMLPLLDYLFHFAPVIRVAALAAFCAMVLALAWRWLVVPLSAKLTDQFLAGRVEVINRPLADELMAALQFIKSGLPEHNVLAAKAVEGIESRAAGMRFEDALQMRGPRRVLGGAGILLALLVIIGFSSPALASVAFSRWTDPFGAHDWPRTTRVQFEWPNGKVPTVHPIGDPLTLRAVVTQGHWNGMRVFVYTWSDTQGEQRELMNYQEGQSDKAQGRFVYEKRLEPAGDAVFYVRLEAGDDTEQGAVKIRLAARPEVAAVKAEIVPPAYAHAAAGRSYDLLSEIGRAIEGSTIKLTVKSTKPFTTAPDMSPLNLLEPGKDNPILLAAVQRTLTDANTAVLTFRADRSLEFRPQVRDADDFDNRVGSTLRLEVVPDALPTVVIAEPRRPMEVVAEAVLNVQVQATDDLGLGEVLLQADNFDAKPGDEPRFHQPLTWAGQTPETTTMSVTGTANYEWKLAPLSLKPGDRLSFYGVVRDNYAMPLAEFPGGSSAVKEPFEKAAGDIVQHRPVRSAPLSLMIQTKERIEENTRKDLQEVRDEIRRLSDQQALVNQQTKAIQSAAQAAGRTTPEQKQQLAELAGQQANEAQRAMGLQTRVEQVRQAMKVNQMDQSDLGKIAQDVSTGMTDVGQNNMPKAAGELSKAQEAAGKQPDSSNPAAQKNQEKQNAEQAAANAGNAAQQQELALSTMNKLIDKLGAAGDFEAHRSKVNEILEKQKELEKDLRAAAASTLGRPLSQLSPQERAALDKVAQEQQKLAQETSKLTEGMEKTADQLSKSDPASSESLKRAAQAARDQQVAGKQSSASQNSSQNQMSNASNDMTQARRGLEDMKNELDQQNRRQLEQLALQLQQLLDSLIDIRQKQLAVNEETVKSTDKAKREILEPLGNRQSRLQGNTLAESQRAESMRDGRPIASDLTDAATAMGLSTAALLKTAQPDALSPEKDALAALDKAIDKLQKQKKQVDDQLKDQDLAAIRQQYEEIKTAQEQVATATNDLMKRLAGKEPQRADLAAMSSQAAAQAKLIESVQKLSQNQELAKFDVVVWINQQIIENMTDSRSHLEKTQLDKPLVDAQAGAIARLQEIIDALKEEQSKKDDFANDNSGGGGGGGGQKPPLLPPTAQLKLLKSQQARINAATIDTDKELAAAQSDADKVRAQQETAKLGQNQEKIKTLAEKVVNDLKK